MERARSGMQSISLAKLLLFQKCTPFQDWHQGGRHSSCRWLGKVRKWVNSWGWGGGDGEEGWGKAVSALALQVLCGCPGLCAEQERQRVWASPKGPYSPAAAQLPSGEREDAGEELKQLHPPSTGHQEDSLAWADPATKCSQSQRWAPRLSSQGKELWHFFCYSSLLPKYLSQHFFSCAFTEACNTFPWMPWTPAEVWGAFLWI